MNNIFIVKIKGYLIEVKVEVKVKNSGTYLFSTSA
jgi:hypothetical protein